MKPNLKSFFEASVSNITGYGDTDIFPFPIENHIIHDKKTELVKLLRQSYSKFEDCFVQFSPSHLSALSPIGNTGFRWATQLDPYWNAYFLGLALSVGADIESQRIPKEKGVVFSYRIKENFDDGQIFDDNVGYKQFIEKSIHMAKDSKFVVVCDIADCYQRIYHHRLENALKQLPQKNSSCGHIMEILANFSNTKSYGLPIGGPAARILVELVLNLTDQLLKSHQIKFSRFADDYHIFVDNVDEAYEKLLFISEKILRNDGLSLQKSKTRVMTSSEFINSQTLVISSEQDASSEIGKLFSLNLKFDPYSPEAEEEYEALKSELKKIDIIGLLNLELAKTRVHGAVTKRIISAIRHLDNNLKEDAVLTLVGNLDSLYPVFPVVAVTIKHCFAGLSDSAKEDVCKKIRERVISKSYIFSTELHAAFAVRILSELKSSENEDVLVTLFNRFNGALVRRDVILAMANWKEFAWLADLQNEYQGLSAWEKRAFIIASYTMGDAGSHWREHMKKQFNPFEKLVRDWAAEQVQKKSDWRIPL